MQTRCACSIPPHRVAFAETLHACAQSRIRPSIVAARRGRRVYRAPVGGDAIRSIWIGGDDPALPVLAVDRGADFQAARLVVRRVALTASAPVSAAPLAVALSLREFEAGNVAAERMAARGHRHCDALPALDILMARKFAFTNAHLAEGDGQWQNRSSR